MGDVIKEDDRKGNLVSVDRTRILIVDDEKSIRDVFSHVIAYYLPGCRIDLAVNGFEAVEAFRGAHHGVLLMDIRMPVMDGLKAFQVIRQMCTDENVDMPSVVFCTGFEPPTGLRNMIGGDQRHCVLSKPVKNDVLIDALRSRLTPL